MTKTFLKAISFMLAVSCVALPVHAQSLQSFDIIQEFIDQKTPLKLERIPAIAITDESFNGNVANDLLDTYPKLFCESGQLKSFHLDVLNRFNSDAGRIEQMRELFNGPSETAFDDIITNKTTFELFELVYSYPYSTGSQQALRPLMTWAVDHGDYQLASLMADYATNLASTLRAELSTSDLFFMASIYADAYQTERFHAIAEKLRSNGGKIAVRGEMLEIDDALKLIETNHEDEFAIEKQTNFKKLLTNKKLNKNDAQVLRGYFYAIRLMGTSAVFERAAIQDLNIDCEFLAKILDKSHGSAYEPTFDIAQQEHVKMFGEARLHPLLQDRVSALFSKRPNELVLEPIY